MATVNIVLTSVQAAYSGGQPMPVVDSTPPFHETIASSGASQQSASTAPATAKASLLWQITALGSIWVKFGTNPTAVAGSDYLIASGQTREFDAKPSHKCAIIDAT